MPSRFQIKSENTKGLASGRLQSFIDFWRDHASEDGWVDKRYITLSKLWLLSPNLILLKRAETGRWRFTLIGTDIVEEYKEDFTGCYIEDIPHEECRTLYREATSRTAAISLAHRLEGNFCNNDGGYQKAEEVAIPVSKNAQDVTHVMILCLVDRSDPERSLYDDIGHDSFDYKISPIKRREAA
jgi:hypothetical protein